ncbi:MAG: DUF222 domain-containing protein [Micromonosporaceae bacterium]
MSVSAPQAFSWSEAAAAVAAAVDVLTQVCPADLGDAQLAVALEQAAVQAARLHAVAAGVVAEADARRVWRTQGAASLGGWVRRCVQLADDAARLVAVARMRAFLPKMAGLFSAGRVSLAQMGTAARQVRRLPDGPQWSPGAASPAAPTGAGAAEGVPYAGLCGPPGPGNGIPGGVPGTDQNAPGPCGGIPGAGIPGAGPCGGLLSPGGGIPGGGHNGAPGPGGGDFTPTMWGNLWAAADDILAARAPIADARMLAAIGEQIHAAADPGGHPGAQLSLRDRRHRSVCQGFEGMGEITGRLDPAAAERAITVLTALAQKAGPGDDRTAAQRRADALDTLCTSWLESGHLPAPKDGSPRRGRVIVTIPYPTLMRLPAAPSAILGTGTPIPAETARRIACDASIRRIVTTSPGDRLTCLCGHTCSFTAGPGGSSGQNRQAPATSANSNPGRIGPMSPANPSSGGAAGRASPARPDPGSRPGRAGSDPPRYDPTATLTAALRAAIAALPPPLGTRPAILDAGRSTPTFTQPMRDALHAQYGGHCAFPGCGQPATIDHHIVHWADGGPTSTANAAPLCDYHHYLVHEGGWHLHKDPHGHITTIPPPLSWRGPRRHWRNGRLINGPPPDPLPPPEVHPPGNGYPP